MKIPRAKLVKEAHHSADAAKARVKNDKEAGVRSNAELLKGARGNRSTVDISLAKAIAEIPDSNRARVDELKARYQSGEKLSFPGDKVANATGKIIAEEIFFGRLFGGANEADDTE